MRRKTPVAILAAGVLAGLLPALTPAAGAASADGAMSAAAGPTTLCAAGERIHVDGRWGDYVLMNNTLHPRSAPECISHYRPGPSFAVIRSGANSHGPESEAYPNLFSGCSWGFCSDRSALPARVFSLRHPWVSWSARFRPGGKWDANLDMWLSRSAQVRGQVTGAEVMIWVSAHGFAHVGTVTRIDGIRWHFVHWTTRSLIQRHVTWPLIIFRTVRPRHRVGHLALKPFFRYLRRLHLIHRGYWLDSVHAGFEIWNGGRGLRMLRFQEGGGLQKH